MTERKLVRRSKFASYMNTGAAATPVFSRIGEGFTDLSESKNPKEYTAQYVHEETERNYVIGYAPSISYSVDYYDGDPCVRKIADITDNERTGSDAIVEIVNVNLYEQTAPDSGKYVAYKRSYSVIPDTKGEGVEALVMTGSFTAVGEKVRGEWTPTAGSDTGTFAEATESE